jgi:hypothetical protein
MRVLTDDKLAASAQAYVEECGGDEFRDCVSESPLLDSKVAGNLVALGCLGLHPIQYRRIQECPEQESVIRRGTRSFSDPDEYPCHTCE